MIGAGAVGAVAGAIVTGRLDERRLQRGFAPCVVVVGVWLVARNFFPHAAGVMRS